MLESSDFPELAQGQQYKFISFTESGIETEEAAALPFIVFSAIHFKIY